MILTKKEYCKMQLEMRVDPNELTPDLIRELAMSSTTLGICLEELGYINEIEYPDLVEYLSSRGGTFATYIDKSINPSTNEPTVKIMSFREFLSLLPSISLF